MTGMEVDVGKTDISAGGSVGSLGLRCCSAARFNFRYFPFKVFLLGKKARSLRLESCNALLDGQFVNRLTSLKLLLALCSCERGHLYLQERQILGKQGRRGMCSRGELVGVCSGGRTCLYSCWVLRPAP